MKNLKDLVCDLCDQVIEDVEKMDAEAFGDARDRTSDEMIFIMLRCLGCRAQTVVCNGGDA